MPAINLEAMPKAARESFLRALAKELYRIREDPEIWAKVQKAAKARETREARA